MINLPNEDFSNKIETGQSNAALAIMGAIKRHLAKNYQELELEYLQQKRWMRCLCLVYKVITTKMPAFIYDFIPPVIQSEGHRNSFKSFCCRTDFFKNSFFSLRYG